MQPNCVRYAEAEKLKTEGNKYFEDKDLKNALKCYHMALLYVKGSDDTKCRKLESSIQVNIAACHLQTGKLQRVIECCEQAIDLDPINEKAWYRKAKAMYFSSRLSEARRAARVANQLCGGKDTSVKRLLENVEQTMKDEESRFGSTFAHKLRF